MPSLVTWSAGTWPHWCSATPGSAEGRPSKSLTVDQARRLLTAAQDTRWFGYIMVSMMTGIRTEEARALTWANVDLEEPSIAVYRSVRSHGDTKTPKSRRKLLIPERAADALLSPPGSTGEGARERPARGGKSTGSCSPRKWAPRWMPQSVRRAFKDVCEKAEAGSGLDAAGAAPHVTCRYSPTLGDADRSRSRSAGWPQRHLHDRRHLPAR